MPSIQEIIKKKKTGLPLTAEEIAYFVKGYTRGEIPDYQASALLMAICLRGMSDEEAAILTGEMMHSGDIVDLSPLGSHTADKHSTGGIGDKTTLIVAPLAASLGCTVAKMSGRGLGHTGGTVDKLEAIPGYRTSLTPEEFFETVRRVGVAVVGQSGDLAPADKKLYALRDVTETVDSIPLIAASIMSKKLASGADSIVLDVKVGSGAFMKSEEEARHLARLMVKIGRLHGRRAVAVLSDMDAPLGYAVGNSLEVEEAVAVLCGRGPRSLRELSVTLAATMAEAALGLGRTEALARAEEALDSGRAFRKMCEWVEAQGGDSRVLHDTALLPKARESYPVLAEKDGYLGKMDAEAVGRVSVMLGAGREVKDAPIDPAAGILFHKLRGERVARGEVIATLMTSTRGDRFPDAAAGLTAALAVTEEAPKPSPIILDVIS